MREFWMRLMSAVVIVGLILGYNSVLEARAKDEEIAKLNAKIENTESLEDEDSKNGSYKRRNIYRRSGWIWWNC